MDPSIVSEVCEAGCILRPPRIGGAIHADRCRSMPNPHPPNLGASKDRQGCVSTLEGNLVLQTDPGTQIGVLVQIYRVAPQQRRTCKDFAGSV